MSDICGRVALISGASCLLALPTLVLFPALAVAQTHETAFESGVVELRASLHMTPDREPRALVIYPAGNPGGPIDQPSTTVDALVAAGVDVFRFNYRGLWGNGGDFTLTNAIGDLDAALDYLTAPETVERLGHDPPTILLVGYSFGTAAGLLAPLGGLDGSFGLMFQRSPRTARGP